MDIKNQEILKKYVSDIESVLYNYTKCDNIIQKNVLKAMEYSLSAGGKRIRPVLMLEFYRMCGGENDITPIACTIEMIHTFSLIHDDLPCMDNDDFRRGKPSCHKAYGEAIALLAGDALATLPYEIISDEALKGNISFEIAAKLIKQLSNAVGADGMIGGQVIDIENEGKLVTTETLMVLDKLKTGALIKAACVMGCILADATDEQISKAIEYAEKIGHAFQIIDDILDVTSTFEKLGKPIKSDEKQNKSTYVSLYGLEASKEIAQNLSNEALKTLEYFEDNQFMIDLTKMLLSRNN